MNLYLNELRAGFEEMLALHKAGENIFEMGSGPMFPTHDKQQMWQFARGEKHLRLSDGTNVHHFNIANGDLDGGEADLERVPEIPLPDMFNNSTSKGKAQVHRSDPASVYFTLQEGTRNPTYTFKHIGGAKWKAVPKKSTAKQHLAQPAPIPNVNVEGFKQAAEDGSFFNQLDSVAGKGVLHGGNAAVRTLLSPGEIRMPFTNGYGQDARPWEMKDSLMAGGVGALAGGGYHLAKRHLLNTPDENAAEDEDPNTLTRRMAVPAIGLAALNGVQNSLLQSQPDGKNEGYYDQAVRGRPYKFFGA